MPQNFVFIDYENLQPETLPLIADLDLRVFVFVGSKQGSVPLPLAMSLQDLGERVKYVHIERQGPNALDFCIAFHVGVVVSTVADAVVHIVSRDKGYDALIGHLRNRKVRAARVESLKFLPIVENIKGMTPEDRADLMLRLLFQFTGRPKSPQRLRQTIHTLCQQSLSEQQCEEVLAILVRRGQVTMAGEEVRYREC
jgi:hypothetical protein